MPATGSTLSGPRNPGVRSFPGADLLTIAETAERMGLCERTVRKQISLGELKVFRLGPKIVRVHRSSVDQFIESCSSGGLAAAM